jgi:DNA-binding MarR family transcriptional regulator
MSQAKALINELLVDVFNHILDIEEDTLHSRGVKLSMKEVHILEAVRNGGESPIMTKLAQKLQVTVGTLTIAIGRLVAKNYVIRRQASDDRRKVMIFLTPKAEEILRIHDAFHEEMIEALIEDMELEEDEVLLKSLENIVHYFKDKYK